MIDIQNLSKHYGGLSALSGCTTTIETGKITAIIGPNGSGKSTLFNILSRIEKTFDGEIYLQDSKIRKLTDHEISKTLISRTFQHVQLCPNLTIREHLQLILEKNNDSILSAFTPQENHETKIKEILLEYGIEKSPDTYVTDLSYGQRKLLDLAMAITKPHKILLLDEPVAGVNPALREKIATILKTLHEKGETIVVIEHDMNFIMNLAQHVIVLHNGSVIAEGKPKNIQKNKEVLSAYLGE